MHIVEVLGVLISKKNAAIAMSAGVLEIPNTKSKKKIVDGRALQQRKMQGAANLRLVVAFSSSDRQHRFSIDAAPLPRRRVDGAPASLVRRKVFGEDFLVSGRGVLTSCW
jgi:hypothetical protein